MGMTQSDLERVGRMLSDKYGVRVVCRGNRCKTDGRTIYLPGLPDDQDVELVHLVRYYLDHECGHIVGKSDLVYFQEVLDRDGPEGQLIMDSLEDCRVDQIMADIWRGCGVNIRVGMKTLLQRLEGDATTKEPLRQFITAIFLTAKGLPIPLWVPDECTKVADKYSDRLQEIPLWAKETRDVDPLYRELFEEYKKLNPRAAEQNESKLEPLQQPSNVPPQDKTTQIAGAGGGQADGEQEQEGQTATHEGQPGGQSKDAQKPDAKEPPVPDVPGAASSPEGVCGPGGSGASADPDRPPTKVDVDKLGMRATLEKAIDDHMQGLKPSESFLRDNMRDPAPVAPWPGRETTISQLIFFSDMVKRSGGVARRRLEQLLMVEAKSWWRGDRLKGLPDARNLSKLAADTGDRVFRQRTQQFAKDTACCLLVDGSGSMHGWHGRMLPAMVAAAAFSLTLDACGHANCVYVFENYLDPVGCARLRNIKGWKDRACRRMRVFADVASQAGGGTPMAEAVNGARLDLMKRPEKRKVLIVFTDGGAGDVQATICAFAACERVGIEAVAFGIETSSVRRLHHRCVVMKTTDGLDRELFSELAKALGYAPGVVASKDKDLLKPRQ